MESCGKVGYSTKKQAHHAMRLIQRKSKGPDMRVYYCHCFRYHLTSDKYKDKILKGKYEYEDYTGNKAEKIQ